MQKRVVYNFNAQTATESAAENSTDKAVKTSNATGKIKRAFSGKSFKLVVLIVLLFASLFCTICSADWMISQQKVVPNVAGNSIFKFDDLGFGAHVNNGNPTENYTFNGSSISISMSAAAVGGVQNLPDSAIDAQNIRYRVKNCAPDTQPENLSEEFFSSDYTTVLPKDAGTYAVLITSEADGVSYGKTIKVFTIAPCPVKIEWSGAVDFTYDGTDHRSNITATARTENGAAVNENIFKISFSYKAHGATTFTPVTEVKNAGTYTATAEISNNNYTISSNEAATFTIGQRQVTVSDWGNTSFTYNGKAQKPEPSFNNVVNGDNLNATVTIIGNKQPINKGVYTAKVTISNDNYKLSGSPSTPFTIRPLKIAFDGIIESDYKSGGIALNKELFKGKFKIDETIADASSVDLSTVHNDIIGGTAKNFSNNEDTSKPENGFYSYAFGKNITAGSTYLISNITLDSTSNFELTTKSVYLKYKTAKIGDVYYTIEDALAQSGTITLCGDATSDSSYVITAFARFNNLSGTGFENYKANYEYTLKSNSTLLLPYNSDGLAINSDSDMLKCTSEPVYVYSVLAISQDIKLTISGTLDIGGRLSSKGGDFNQARVKQHSVVYNNGNIVVTNRINSYGYLKGANDGLVELQSTATALDIMLVYDWLAGTEAIQIHNAGIFPFKSYSIHNISCKTKIKKGAKYLAKAALNVQDMLLPSDPITVVGTTGSMFAVESGYILKSASNADSNKSSTDLTSITGTNQLKGQKDIITLGENTICHDNSITLNVQGKKITTSKDYPLPISYFNIVVPTSATLNLNAVSYIFYPGSSLKVEAGGQLKVENVSVAFYTLKDCISDENWEKNRVKYATEEGTNDYAVDRTDAKLSIDAGGTATITSNASISGYITATSAKAKLIINSYTSVTIKVPTNLKAHNEASFLDKLAIAAGTISASITTKTYTAFGNIMTSPSSYAQRDLSAGTYYSTKIGSDYVWFKNSATITYHTNGGTLNGTSGNTTQNITLPSGGYISSNLPEPTRLYYEFTGWYYDKALTQKATAIFASCDLYAKWKPIQYTIKYNLPYGECGTLVNGSLSGAEVKTLATPPQTITVDGTEYTFSGWYLNPDRTGDPITEVSAVNANGQNIINVYAFYRGGTYTVNYEEDPENLLSNNNLKVDKPENQTFDKGKAVSLSELSSLNSYNGDPSFMFYFAGWYLSTDSSTIITSLPSTINGDITLCAKWIKKHIVTINFTSNDSILETENRLGTIVKYYKDGEVNLQNLYNDNSIAAKIDEYYAPHGNIKEYTLIEWQENGTVITTNVVNVTRNFDITAYHKRCYYITVQKLNATVNGITGGLGTFYASPLDTTTFATAITCTLIANKERYTPEYSAINASVDANGVISFANSNSAKNVIVNITSQHWFMVDNQYTSHITLKLNSGRQEGNWFTENANITVTLKANLTKKTAIIQKNDGSTQTLTATFWNTDSKDITISGWYIIKNS